MRIHNFPTVVTALRATNVLGLQNILAFKFRLDHEGVRADRDRWDMTEFYLFQIKRNK